MMKIKRLHIILVVGWLWSCLSVAQAQDNQWLAENNLVMEIRGHYGMFYQHHFEMEPFNAHFPAFEASLYSKTFGQKEWEGLYNYPYIGVTFYHSNLGGFPELGKAYALYPFINYPLIGGDGSELTFKFGAGLAWITNKFDHIYNYKNFAIGSHLNAAINLSFEYRQRLSSRLIAVGSLGLTHFSNGATKSPNYGLNTVSGALGLAYYLRTPIQNYTYTKRPDYYPFEFDGKNWFSVDVGYALGVKDVSQTLAKQERFLVHEFSVQLMAQFTTCSRAGLSMALVQDLSDQALLDHYTDDQGKLYIIQYGEYSGKDTIAIKKYQMIKPNIGICYSMTMDRLSFNFEVGYHLDFRKRVNQRFVFEHDDATNTNYLPPTTLATDFSKGQMYQKVALRYYLFDQVYATLGLTAHAMRADYLCFGLSYRFNQKYYLNKHEKQHKHPPGLQ